MRYPVFATLAIGTLSSVSAQAQSPASTQIPAPAQKSEGPKSAMAANDKASDPDQEIRCRTVKVTGSLIKKGKVCRTLAEWRRMSNSGQDLARRLVEDGTSRSGGQ